MPTGRLLPLFSSFMTANGPRQRKPVVSCIAWFLLPFASYLVTTRNQWFRSATFTTTLHFLNGAGRPSGNNMYGAAADMGIFISWSASTAKNRKYGVGIFCVAVRC